jgi:ATP-dependent exoDNAse (exonuclease V) alpha subunit
LLPSQKSSLTSVSKSWTEQLAPALNCSFSRVPLEVKKTFTMKAFIRQFARRGKKCLMTETTGIAAMQYQGGTTVHSLLKRGIDAAMRGDLRSTIGRNTFDATHIQSNDVIVMDELSMLTPWLANRISLTLRSISDHSDVDFGGKTILFIGDLLQLFPVVQGLSRPVPPRRIIRL